MKGYYVCECGKCFYKPNNFNAHKSHCIKHLGEDRYNQICYSRKAGSKKAGVKCHLKAIKRKNESLSIWILEKHTCEKCGKVMTEKFATGRFCSKSCANSHQKSEASKLKTSYTLRHSLKYQKSIIEPKLKVVSKSGYYKGFYCASTWELAFLIYCLEENIPIERCRKMFTYFYRNKMHRYIPDWYLADTKEYVEIKGDRPDLNYEIIKLKGDSVINAGEKYLYIDSSNMSFYIDYCKNKFKIKNLKHLYENIQLPESRKHVPRTLGYIWMNKNSKNTLIPKDRFDEYHKCGWVKGKIKINLTLD